MTWWSGAGENGDHDFAHTDHVAIILLVSLARAVMGMLNAKHVFGAPPMASSF